MTDIQNTYFETSILTAGPVELVRLLMRRCAADLQHARDCLREGDISGRASAISHAAEILTELICSLDDDRAPEYSANARRLYAYVLERILEGNCRQQDAPLAEAERLMGELAEAWESVEVASSGYAGGFECAPYLADQATLQTCVA